MNCFMTLTPILLEVWNTLIKKSSKDLSLKKGNWFV